MIESLTRIPSLALSPLLFPILTQKSVRENKEHQPDYNNILHVHFKINGTDGVSHEIKNISDFLSQRNKKVFWCSGDIQPSQKENRQYKLIEDLSYQSNKIQDLTKRIFTKRDQDVNNKTSRDQEGILKELEEISFGIEKELESYINSQRVGLIDVRNIFSLPLNLPATLAMYRLMERRTDLLFLLHHHDFVWEWKDRIEKFKTDYPLIQELIEIIYPPKKNRPNQQHVVINTIAQERLLEMGIKDPAVIPDSFDFDRPIAFEDPNKGKKYIEEMKRDLWKRLEIGENNIVIGGMTRITPRKRIELTIQLISEMHKIKNNEEMKRRIRENGGSIRINNGMMTENSQFVLLMCQNEDLDDHREYYEALKAYAHEKGVKMVLAGSTIKRGADSPNGEKKSYPFLDAYSIINGVDYPSEQEGFGNQFLEGVWGGHMMPILEYPVFGTDIKPHLKHHIYQGVPKDLKEKIPYGSGKYLCELDEKINSDAAREWLEILMQPDEYKRLAKENLDSIKNQFDSQVVGENYLSVVQKMRKSIIMSKLEAKQAD